MTTLERRPVDRPWRAYPIGTIAHDVGGGYWTRVADGWRANGGDTFPQPAASALAVTLPAPPDPAPIPDDAPSPSLAYAGDSGGARSGDVWWYYEDAACGVVVGVRNARREPDWAVRDDGSGYQVWDWEYDELAICGGAPTWPSSELPRRPMTDDERDFYADAIRDVLRDSDG